MLNVGFSELLLISAIGLVAIGPKELPTVMRHVVKFFRELQGLGDSVKRQMHEVVKESGLEDFPKTATIIDLDGKKQQAYDVSDLHQLSTSSSGLSRGSMADGDPRDKPEDDGAGGKA